MVDRRCVAFGVTLILTLAAAPAAADSPGGFGGDRAPRDGTAERGAASDGPAADTLEARVDSLMADFAGEGTPGAAVGVVRDGEVVFAEAYGTADLAHGVPVDLGTRFNVGSVSKQFTAFAFALLAERGELSLEDPVAEHLDDWPRFEHEVTLRHLLTHTSGYRQAYGTLALAGRSSGRDRLPREEALEVVRRQPALEFEPGTSWQYNSTAYVVAARVLEEVTGRPFPSWMQANVFGPLGMDSTVIESAVGQVVPGAARSYVPDGEGGYRRVASNRAIYGAAEVFTTVGDLARWIENLESADLGGPSVRERMLERFVLASGDTSTYALGLEVDEHRGLRWIEHSGGHAGYKAQLSWYPELDAGVVVMSGHDGMEPGRTGLRLAEIFFGDRMEPPREPAAVDSARLARYEGRYRAKGSGRVFAFEHRGGELFRAGDERPLQALSDTSFRAGIGGGTVVFHPGPDGAVERATWENRVPVALRRIEPWRPAPAELEAFAGRYVSPELDAVLEFAVEEGRPVVRSRWHGRVPLRPLEEDVFATRGVILEFERNRVGIVTGLYATVGGTRDVWFGRRGGWGGQAPDD